MFVTTYYSKQSYERVRALSNGGESDYEIARQTGVARSTIGRWRRNGHPPAHLTSDEDATWRPVSTQAYCYLLGVYLGDGHLFQTGHGRWRLGITMDARYPGVVGEVVAAIEAVEPEASVCVNRKPAADAVTVLASSGIWRLAFPQHAPGRKHDRSIVLSRWQRELTRSHPEAFLRGLIHSDGCRTLNRFRTKLPSGRVAEYAYPRYFFTNLSADIRGIFCEHCELLGIRWTQSNPRNISVAQRRSVALLDSFVGPKR